MTKMVIIYWFNPNLNELYYKVYNNIPVIYQYFQKENSYGHYIIGIVILDNGRLVDYYILQQEYRNKKNQKNKKINRHNSTIDKIVTFIEKFKKRY